MRILLVFERAEQKKIDVPDEKISRSTAIPTTTTTCVSYCLLFNTGILISRKKKFFSREIAEIWVLLFVYSQLFVYFSHMVVSQAQKIL